MKRKRNNILKDHAKQLRAQITQNEEVRKQERLDYLEEGRKVRQELEDEKFRLKEIKDRKVGELKTLGIPDKYIV